MTGEWHHAPQLYQLSSEKSEVSIMLCCQLCRIPKERNGAVRPNYCLKSEVSIPLCYQLCSTHYTAVQIENCLKSTSTIKIATMKNMDNF